MRTVVYSLSAFCLLAVGLYSAFAKPPATTSRPLNPFNTPANNDAFFDPPAAQRSSPGAANYVQLAEQYAQLLDEEELAAETQELERKLSIKRSAISLETVRQQLTEIIEKYPSTPSAEKAQRLLESLNMSMDAADEGAAEVGQPVPEGDASEAASQPANLQSPRKL